MSFGEAIKVCFQKYAVLSGRARRSEFWYFSSFAFIINFILGLIPINRIINYICIFAIFIPGLAVTVRRFHDIGKSGWYYLFVFIPAILFSNYNILEKNDPSSVIELFLGLVTLVAIIFWTIWMTKDSEPGENKWGPNPKEQTESSSTFNQ